MGGYVPPHIIGRNYIAYYMYYYRTVGIKWNVGSHIMNVFFNDFIK